MIYVNIYKSNYFGTLDHLTKTKKRQASDYLI